MASEATAGAAADLAEVRVAARRRLRQRRLLRIVGSVLIAYGVSGVLVFAAVAQAIGRPLEEADELTVSIEGQRTAVLQSLASAESTLQQTTIGIRNMDASLEQARAATDRASQLSLTMASTMYQLRDQMAITVFGIQPLIGLAPGFDQTGQQMELLSNDVAAIGEALSANREDVETVAASLGRLQQSVARLADAVREGPRLEATSEGIAAIRLGIFAVAAWLITLAIGCVLGGLGCWWLARRA